jgi:hypothetical protein
MYTIASVQCETIIQNSLDYNNNNNNNKISIFRILYIEPAFVISFGLIIFVETLAPIDISFFFRRHCLIIISRSLFGPLQFNIAYLREIIIAV